MQSVKDSVKPIQPVEKCAGRSADLIAVALVSVVVLCTIIAYSQVLFNFFLGDDFVHLTWLKDAVKNPEMIWRNFHSSWLDGTTTRFYRPLISVFMVTDYLEWGPNGLGFHLTNLLFHLAATVILFFTARSLLSDAHSNGQISSNDQSSSNITNNMYAVGAAALFGLYPLHCEAVSWITGRVDAIVTTFYVATFYCYLRWRKRGGQIWFGLAMIAFALGLLSKEMALTLPPAFLLYELLLGDNALFKGSTIAGTAGGSTNAGDSTDVRSSTSGSSTIISSTNYGLSLRRIIDPIKPTSLFWLTIVVYFGLRRHALGTFVGGYDDSLFFIADIGNFLSSWLHGLRMFLVPLNKGLMGSHHIITKSWEIVLCVSLGAVALNVFFERRLLRLLAFNILFLAVCFAPVYKIFTISDDLQGARLAHVATVALCLLLSMAFIVPIKSTGKQSTSDSSSELTPAQDNPAAHVGLLIRSALLIAVASISMTALWTNNQAWTRAGHESNAIRAGLSKLYKHIDGDPQVLLIGLPDQIDGAYTCRNALWGMTKVPQLERDVWNCLMLNRYEQILPFGYLKESIWQSRDQIKLFFWNRKDKEFKPLSIVHEELAKRVWNGEELKEITKVKSGKANWSTTGVLEIRGDNSKNGRPEILIDFGKHSSFDIDFVKLHLRNLDTTGGAKPFFASEGIDLLYANDISPEFDLPNRTHANFKIDSASQDIILPLRSLPEWSLGGTAHPLQLKLPHMCNLAIESIEIVKADRLIPSISFNNSGYLGTKGYLHLSRQDNKANLRLDASRILNAKGVVLEITRPNLFFELQNTDATSKVSMKELRTDVRGEMELTRDLFEQAGMYEVRPWAVDAQGRKLGVAGDHIVISVDS